MIISHQSPARRERVNQQRQQAIAAGFTWQGATFDIDPDSFRLIMSRALRLAINPDIQQVAWRGADNIITSFNRAEFLAFAAAADAHVESLYQASWQQKQ